MIKEDNLIDVDKTMHFTLEGSFIAKAVESYMKSTHDLPEDLVLKFLDLQPLHDEQGIYELVCIYDNLKLH